MKRYHKLFNIIFYVAILIPLTISISSLVFKYPLLITTIRSNSMYHLMEKGDIVFIKPASKNSIQIGDMIVFSTNKNVSDNKLVLHRVVDGNATEGFITKGDANDFLDQDMGFDKVMPENIYSKVITINNNPVKIPVLGHISLWAENLFSRSFLLPVIAIAVVTVLLTAQPMAKKRKKRKKSRLDMPLLYFLTGLVMMIIFGSSMLASSRLIYIPYEVSEKTEGAISGSNIGIIKKGATIENKHISTVSNKGFYPLLVSVTSKDNQLSFDHSTLLLKPGQEIKINTNVNAADIGQYNSTIYVGLFMPFLPLTFIHRLAEVNFWFALLAVSLVPSLPIMLIPILNGPMRRAAVNEIRRKIIQFS